VNRASISHVDVVARVRAALQQDPNVISVDVVGSRSIGTETDLSDWDLRIEAVDLDELMIVLPSLTESLAPLAAQWDRLSDRAVYMLILPGGVKVDLFPGDRSRAVEGPWDPQPENLSAIDAHFWDWILWMGSKALRGENDVVEDELHKLQVNLLGPLGGNRIPQSIASAVEQYLRLRERAEQTSRVRVDRRLGDEVSARLRRAGLA
jgi:hypothetical protein